MAHIRMGSPADQQERDKNRQLLQKLHREHQEFQQNMEELHRGLFEMRQEKAELHEFLARTRSEITNEMTRHRAEFQRELQQMQTQFQSCMVELQGTKRTVDQENMRMRHEITQLKDGGGSKHEMNVLKDATNKHQQELNKLRNSTQSTSEVTRVEAKTDLTTMEFRALRKQIYDRGLLAPKVEVFEEEERPPVGAIELGEDVFTARLLLRLGLMKARAEQHQERMMSFSGGEDEGEDPDADIVLFQNDNVTGLEMPEVVPGTRGYTHITWGFLAVCAATVVVQALALMVMLRHGLEQGGDCFREPPSPMRWWLLHMSKLLAMIVAGLIMGKDLMDTVNFWMVSELLEPRNLEVCFAAAIRAGITFIITSANVVIFMHLTNPADVWLNMTALGFIAEFKSEMLDVSKRGVFGHHIAKTMTNLNFHLTFVSEYPAWFRYVQGLVATITAGIVVVFAGWVFMAPDYMCQ